MTESYEDEHEDHKEVDSFGASDTASELNLQVHYYSCL